MYYTIEEKILNRMEKANRFICRKFIGLIHTGTYESRLSN